MKILLIRASNYDTQGNLRNFKQFLMPPLNLAILKAITPKGTEVKIVDELVDSINFDAEADLIGITAFTMQARRAYEIADEFRKRGKTVVIGGMHASALPNEALKHADSVVVGEAENIWGNLLQDFKDRKLRPLYKSEDVFDMGKSVIPDFSGVRLNRYVRPPFANKPLFPIQITRGCPFNCDFCAVTSFFGGSFRVKPIEQVLKEIKHYKATYYFFVDDNIIGQPEYAKELFKALIPLKINWFGQFSTTLVKFPELARLAAKSGCGSAFLGIESISTKNLKSVNKNFNKTKEYTKLFQLLNKVHIRPWASIIFGFDEDDESIFEKTVRFLIKNRVGRATFFLLTPLPGTKLFTRLNNSKRIVNYDWNDYDLAHAVIKPKLMSGQQLENGLWHAYRKFFTIPKILIRDLKYSVNNPIKYPIMVFYDLSARKLIRQKKDPLIEGGS